VSARFRRASLPRRAEWPAFTVFADATPLTDESSRLICACLNWWTDGCGLSPGRLERLLALHKLETQK